MPAAHETGYHFVQGPVSAGADEQILVASLCKGLDLRVSLTLRCIDADLIAALAHDIDDIRQTAANALPAGVRVENKEQFLSAQLRSFH